MDDLKEMESTLPASQPTSQQSRPPIKRKPFGGKQSHQRRIDKRREIRNIGFNERIDRAFNEKYTRIARAEDKAKTLATKLEVYQEEHQTGTSVIKKVPCTTRGLGLLSAKFTSIVRNLYDPSIRVNDYNVNVHYRVSLLQLQQKVYKCFKEHQALDTEVAPLPRVNKAPVIQERRNFTGITMLMDGFGKFEVEGVRYKCFTPIAESATIDMPTTQAKRARTSVTYLTPDPYHVTILNLRPTCESLANPNVPPALRNAFISRNPIPGAVFEDGLLTNIEEIIPEGYLTPGLGHIDRDLESFSAMMDFMSRSKPHVIGEARADTSGSPVSLVSISTSFSSDFKVKMDDGTCRIESISKQIVRNPISLTNIDRQLGCITLLGEVVKEERHLTPLHVLRMNTNATFAAEMRWNELVQLLD